MKEKLIDYIFDARMAGKSDSQIRQDLINIGLDKALIDDAFAHPRAEAGQKTIDVDDFFPKADRAEQSSNNLTLVFASVMALGIGLALILSLVYTITELSKDIDSLKTRVSEVASRKRTTATTISRQQAVNVSIVGYNSMNSSQRTDFVCSHANGISSQDACYSLYAIKERSAELCKRVTDIKIRDDCIMSVVLETGDKSICSMIIGQSRRLACQQMGASGHVQPINVVDTQAGGWGGENATLVTRQAVEQKSEVVCNQLSKAYEREFCTIKVAVEKKDASLCMSLKQIPVDDCKKQVAATHGMQALCPLMRTPSDAEICRIAFSDVKITKSECLKQRQDTGVSDCIYVLALRNGAHECLSVVDKEFIKNCVDRVNSLNTQLRF